MKEALALLPNIQHGEDEYVRQLRIFIRQFKPTTREIRCMLMTSLGVTWSRIQDDFPQEDVRPAPDTQADYDAAVDGLYDRITAAFPTRMDV